jgi:hypothetical protein
MPLSPPGSHTPFTSAQNMYGVSNPQPYLISPVSVSSGDSYGSRGFDKPRDMCVVEEINFGHVRAEAPLILASGQSPRLADLLLSGTDHCAPPEEFLSYRTQHEAFYTPTGLTPPAELDCDVEELPYTGQLESTTWSIYAPLSAVSSSSSSSSDSQDYRLLVQPHLSLESPEMLGRQFTRDTCGVLSVKDGPTENPWRTLVWPLTHDCPALYHAIASMTSFHLSADTPAMRIQGIDHMRTAVRELAEGLQNMRFDAAISTTLVLAFAESWDQHISTGINHIKGAKLLINQALLQHRRAPRHGDDWNRLKFLCNTWIYMDVIARLTSTDEDESNDVDAVHDSIYSMGRTETSLDPLMGCAHSLFPIIGRVANLVRKIRRVKHNGPAVIFQASQLKVQLEDWRPPSFIEDPEDETTSPRDSIKTAIAYQYATLLYLHQAVPEMPSLSSSALATRVLDEIATVEPQSRSTIVHIYPLMAAGCEVTKEEDRDWVSRRWELMSSRMKLGLLEKTLQVTKEVWARRDEYAANCLSQENTPCDRFSSHSPFKREYDQYVDNFFPGNTSMGVGPVSKRSMHNPFPQFEDPATTPVIPEQLNHRTRHESPVEFLEPEFTVNGRLHWLGVMQDWSWEGEFAIVLFLWFAN